jgi:hypothetical protein
MLVTSIFFLSDDLEHIQLLYHTEAVSRVPCGCPTFTMAATTISMIDPLERLPYELWVKTFQCVVSDRREGTLPYLAVSQKWSQTILEEPSLWTSIIIDGDIDEVVRIYIFLHLSRDHLLDVTVMGLVTLVTQLDDGLQVALEQGHRIRSLTLSDKLGRRGSIHLHRHEVKCSGTCSNPLRIIRR